MTKLLLQKILRKNLERFFTAYWWLQFKVLWTFSIFVYFIINFDSWCKYAKHISLKSLNSTKKETKKEGNAREIFDSCVPCSIIALFFCCFFLRIKVYRSYHFHNFSLLRTRHQWTKSNSTFLEISFSLSPSCSLAMKWHFGKKRKGKVYIFDTKKKQKLRNKVEKW